MRIVAIRGIYRFQNVVAAFVISVVLIIDYQIFQFPQLCIISIGLDYYHIIRKTEINVAFLLGF